MRLAVVDLVEVMDGVAVREGELEGHAGGKKTARYALLVCIVTIDVDAIVAVLSRQIWEKSRSGVDTAYRINWPFSVRPAKEYTGSAVAKR